MANNFARPGTKKDVPVAEAKAKVLEAIKSGLKVEEACRLVGRSVETYRSWRKDDAAFKAAVDDIRTIRAEEKETGKLPVPDFPEFCAVYLNQPLAEHQLRMWDVIEGREPRSLHDSMTYEPGYLNRVLINVPPHHAKTTTFTVNYVVWLIHKNPDIRVVLVSKGLPLARDFLYEIKLKLTSPLYREMHIRFGPEGGWKDPDGSWTGDRIYVKGKNESDLGVQKDPTVQVMGLKGQIYGRRADVIILDDIIDAGNASEVQTQLTKINRDISSRLPPERDGGGLLAVLGTRVRPMDIYRTLTDAVDGDLRRVWTYFRMPAVLDYGDGDSSTWKTLWPELWDGPSLSKKRLDQGWNLYYQQLDVEDDMTFRAEAVNASINGMRFPGPMTVAGMGHRANGMDGLYVAIGLDPAASGNTAMIVAALDRETEKRYIIDGWNKPNATATDIIEKFQAFTDLYRPNEWVIETNAFQRFLSQLPEVLNYARARGVQVNQHHTQSNKFDADWGVSTMGPLFDSCVHFDPERKMWLPTRKGLIELPSTRQNRWVQQLVQQLTTWQPEGMAQKAKTDLVMALWFTHMAFLKKLRRAQKRQTHLSSPFLSPAARAGQQVINLAELRRLKQEAIA